MCGRGELINLHMFLCSIIIAMLRHVQPVVGDVAGDVTGMMGQKMEKEVSRILKFLI